MRTQRAQTQGTGPGLPLPALSAVRPSPRLCVCRGPGTPRPAQRPPPQNRTPNPPAWSQLKRDPVIRLSSVLHDLFLPRVPALAGRPRACTMKKPPAPREARTPAGGGHVRSVSCPGSETPASCATRRHFRGLRSAPHTVAAPRFLQKSSFRFHSCTFWGVPASPAVPPGLVCLYFHLASFPVETILGAARETSDVGDWRWRAGPHRRAPSSRRPGPAAREPPAAPPAPLPAWDAGIPESGCCAGCSLLHGQSRATGGRVPRAHRPLSCRQLRPVPFRALNQFPRNGVRRKRERT